MIRKRIQVLLVAFSVLGAASCSKPPTTPAPELYTIDSAPTWSPDGSEVVFQRHFSSSYGGPGVYAIPSAGGSTELIAPQLFRDIVFAPSGNTLAAIRDNYIFAIDRATGEQVPLLYTDNIANHPHWAPDGMRIVYSRNGRDPGEPEDSAGIHIIDLNTGINTPIKHNGQRLVGSYPQWSPADTIIAFVGIDGAYLVTPDGARLTRLPLTASAINLSNPQWIDDGATLLINDLTGFPTTRAIDIASQAVSVWPLYVGPFRAIAPADSAFVYLDRVSSGSADGALVLFTRHLNSAQSSSIRPLTSFQPATP